MAIHSDTFTERLLLDAGIAPGMRVLDVGCGNGEVSLLLAKLVGESGSVVGIDHQETALAAARQRARNLALANVSFQPADLAVALPDLEPVDAVVGRRVLMYLPDPVAAIRRLLPCLLPGGVVVFQESDSTMIPAHVRPFPLHERVSSWIWQTVEREGADIHMGFHLPDVLAQAGLALEHIRAEAIIQGQNTPYPLAAVVRAMLPRMIEHGVASPEEIAIETLDQRLLAERSRDNSVYISDMAFGVWGRQAR